MVVPSLERRNKFQHTLVMTSRHVEHHWWISLTNVDENSDQSRSGVSKCHSPEGMVAREGNTQVPCHVSHMFFNTAHMFVHVFLLAPVFNSNIYMLCIKHDRAYNFSPL